MRLTGKRIARGRGGLFMVGAALLAAGLLLTVAPGRAAAAVTPGARVSGTAASAASASEKASASSSAMAVAKPLNGTVGVVPDQSGYSCVVDVRKSKTVAAYEPMQLYHTARSYSVHWLVFPYSVTHARVVNSRDWTFQVQLCGTGGGNTWNVWDQYFDGLGMMLAYTAPKMIGWSWASKVDNGTASASLNFEVNVGVVKIGGTDAVSSYGTHSGNPGVNTNIGWPNGWNKYNVNRMNTYYSSPHTFWYQGTSAFEGNVGHALYEFVTNGTVNFSYGANWTIAAQCHRLVGTCVPFA